MKENPDRTYVHPKFKTILAVEAASKGKSIIEFTKDLAESPDPFKSIADEWDKKWKTQKKERFDFP